MKSRVEVESKLWMMTGEDAPFGSRQIQYYNEAYCSEVLGTLDGATCKPSGPQFHYVSLVFARFCSFYQALDVYLRPERW